MRGILSSQVSRLSDTAAVNADPPTVTLLRLTGPEKTVTANADAFRAAFGADAKAEKERAVTQE